MRSGRRLSNRAGVRQRPAPTAQLTGTRLGRSMRATDPATARDEIRAAAERVRWRDPRAVAELGSRPVRSIVAGIFFGRRVELLRAGVAPIGAGSTKLIGFEDAAGLRYFLLHRTDGLLVEALYVLQIAPVERIAA